MAFTLVVFLVISGAHMGNTAFNAGLPVKRWAMLGVLLGPAAYPLFNTHRHLAYKRAMGRAGCSVFF